MRVISGSKKGLALHAASGHSTRPTTDKVKEALFNLIGQTYVYTGVGLDLYAGTGSLGIEALSRGLAKVIFVERDRLALEVIKKNLHLTGFTEESEVYKNDALRALKVLGKRKILFNLIFLDPPYEQQNIANVLAIIEQQQLLAPEGLIVVETMKDVVLPTEQGEIQLGKQREYGDTKISIYRKESNEYGN